MRINRYLVNAAIFLTIVLFSLAAQAEVKIRGLMFSDEVRYEDAMKGFKAALKKGGYGEQKTIIALENAEGNKAKTVELVQKLSSEKSDLLITLGTTATVAVSRAIKDMPIVFSVVYDPVVAGITKTWKSSENNTTGTSTKIPMSKFMDILKLFPSIRKLAVLYTPGEKNSESTLIDLQRIEANYRINVVPVRLASIEDVPQIMPEVLRTTDAAYITGGHLFDSQVGIITDMAAKANVPTITHLDDLVAKGVLMGVCADPFDLGQQAGLKAVKILNGVKPSSLPIDFARKTNVLLNMKTAQKGQVQLPADFLKTVTKRIE